MHRNFFALKSPLTRLLSDSVSCYTHNMNIHIYLNLLRCNQYTKNLFCLIPCFYGNELFDICNFTKSVITFVIFCMISSSVYILNDLADYESDKRHKYNSSRAIASGKISRPQASAAGCILCNLALFLAYFVDLYVMVCIALYIFVNLLYCLKLKSVFLVDLLCIVAGFELRTFAGCAAIEHSMTAFLFFEVFIFCSMLVLSKRLIERRNDKYSRATLKYYKESLCKKAMLCLAVILNLVWISYVFYGEPAQRLSQQSILLLALASLFVFNSTVRYLQLVYEKVADYDFYSLLYRDRLLAVNAVSFIILNMFALYL